MVRCERPEHLASPKLGATGTVPTCTTCGGDVETCPGHCGWIDLAEPLYHILFIGRVAKTLAAVCTTCGTADVPCAAHAEIGATGRARYTVTGDRLYDNWHKQDVPAAEALEMLSRIADADLPRLGWHAQWARPEWAILTALVVLPPAARPEAIRANARPTRDALTTKYAEIVRLNTVLRAMRSAPSHVRGDYRAHLQWHVTTLFNSDERHRPRGSALFAGPDRGGGRRRPAACVGGLKQRLTGKEGRIRQNLMGKRCDYTARTVISPDARLAVDEVGIPRDVASRLTVPMRVTPANVHEVAARIRAGQAHYYIDGAGRRYALAGGTFRVETLRPGDVVDRALEDGDVVVLNRQPTLHVGSMMAHRVRVLDHKTFRLNLCVTAPYNADFDGDEMNLHVPQTLQARAEAEMLMAVGANTLSAQTNGTMIGLVQDALLGMYLLSNGTTWFDRHDAMDLLAAARPDAFPVLPIPAVQTRTRPAGACAWWSGKQLVSTLLPSWLTTRGGLGTDTVVVIRGGDLLVGALDKRTVGRGAGPGSVVHLLAHRTPQRRVFLDFLEAAQRLAAAYLLLRGFSVGIGSCCPDIAEAQQQRPMNGVHQGKRDVSDLAAQRDAVGRKVRSALRHDNALVCMSSAGSKGSLLNIAQIAGCLGQQAIAGDARWQGRAPIRALPHFAAGDWGAAAGGYVASSYLAGLNPSEFFFHAMCGRDGIIDTACKTATTGYIARRLVKALEDVHVAYDTTVRRRADGAVLAFAYGEGDGYNAARLVDVPVDDASTAPMPFDARALWHDAAALSGGIGADERVGPVVVDAFIATLVPPLAAHVSLVYDGLVRLDRSAWTYFVGEARRLAAVATVHPGEMVGVVAASCLAEPATQLTLNTFHQAGVESAVARGVPRLLELLNVTRNPKATRIWHDDSGTPMDVSPLFVRDLVVDVAHLRGTLRPDDAMWLAAHRDVFGPHGLSPLLDGRWVVRWTLSEPIPTSTTHRFEREAGYTVRFLSTAWPRPILVAVADVPDHTHCRAVQHAVEGAVVRGAALPKASPLVHAFVTTTTTDCPSAPLHICTDDPRDAAAVLGIEAARAVLLHELRAVLSSNGCYVNARHTALLADVMCHRGVLDPVTRHGCARSCADAVLARTSFESSVSALVDGAAQGTRDPVRGVSAHIMLGRVAPAGTGLRSTLFLDEHVLEACSTASAGHGVLGPYAVYANKNDDNNASASFATSGGLANPFCTEVVSNAVGGIDVNPWFPGARQDEDDDGIGDLEGTDAVSCEVNTDTMAVSSPRSLSLSDDDDEARFSPIATPPSTPTTTSSPPTPTTTTRRSPSFPPRKRRCLRERADGMAISEAVLAQSQVGAGGSTSWAQARPRNEDPFVFCVAATTRT